MKKHLHNSLRALFLSLAVLLSLPMMAVEVEIDGINYELVAKIKEATVIAKSSGKYSGKIVIPETVEYNGTVCNVTSIGKSAFYQCSGLTSVTIGNSVTSIGKEAFYGCSGLTSVHISDIAAWCNIEFDGFYSNPLVYTHHLYLNGEEVKDLIIPNSVESIGKYAFYNCSGLTSVTIPNSVTSIGDHAFYSCFGLTSVTIGNSVTSIGEEAFSSCSGLTSVTIPNSVTSIGDAAFLNCSGLTSVHISDIAAWCNIKFVNSYSNPLVHAHHLYLNGEEVKDLIIPNSVESIGKYAFYNCSGLTSVTIPNSVTSIGVSAFSGCSGLTSVTIPNSVTSIGWGAFYSCSGLTSVTIGSGVKKIYSSAFANSPELLDVYCYAEKVPSTDRNAFDGSDIEYANLHVPAASIESYKANTPWSKFGKIVGLSGGGPEVEKCATPVVSYADGKLSMACETEGAKFITKVMSDDITTYYDAEIEFSATYNIEVYATKSGYDNSDTISVALVWIENGDVSEDTGVISVESTPVLITCCNGTINVCGGKDGTKVAVYTTSGVAVGNTTIINGNAVINTSLTKGDIAIVNIAGKGIKVVMQ